MARRPSGATQRLPIDQVVLDDTLYPRNQPDWLTVYRYSEAMAQGAVFPPIVVGRKDKFYICLDGRHRVLATKKRDRGFIEGIISPVKPEQFFFESVRLNAAHGRPLSTQERVSAALRLREAGIPMPKIAEALWMPVPTIERLLVDRVEYIKVDGTEAVVRKSPVPAHRLRRPGDQQSFSVRSQVAIFQQALAIIEHGLLDVTNADVLAVVERLRLALTNLQPTAEVASA
jgi:hypothetical protein